MADDKGEVWVQLYVGEDKSGHVFPIEIASLAKDRIHELTEAVKDKRPNRLAHCDAADLAVYNPGTEFPRNEEDKVDPGDDVSEYTTTSKNPLRVVAPENKQQGKNLWCFLSFLIILVRCIRK